MNKKENLHWKTDRGGVNELLVASWFQLQLWVLLLVLNYNLECDWLTELSHSKLPNNSYASELVEKRGFLNKSQLRKR